MKVLRLNKFEGIGTPVEIVNDILNLYKKSFNIKIPFHTILDNEFCEWLDIFEKSTNCSKSLVLPSIISLTAALCGPKTEVLTGAGEFHNT